MKQGKPVRLSAMLLICGALLLGGCSTNSLLVSYPSQARAVKDSLGEGNLEESHKKLSKNAEKSADRILYLQERGRVADLKGDSQASIEDYSVAASLIESNRQKALVSMTELGGNAASLFSNDNAIPYAGHGYEKVFLHTYNALSYLELKDRESALVEVRKANNEQQYALSLHEKEVNEARSIAKKNRISLGADNASVKKAYDAMANQAGSVKDSFQNAFTYYLSALFYEIEGQLEDAYIDYKKALEIYPDNEFMRDAALRLAKVLGRAEDLEYYLRVYDNPVVPVSNPHKRRVLVVYEEGFVPEKQSLSVPFFWDNKSYTISMPYYNSQGGLAYPLHIDYDGRHLANTELACSVGAMAVKSLMEDYNMIFIRQAMRLLVKHEVQNKSSGENAYLGAFVAIASFVTERADQRSWLTLPNYVQIADVLVEEDAEELVFTTSQGQATAVDLRGATSRVLVVRVINTRGKLYTKLLNA